MLICNSLLHIHTAAHAEASDYVDELLDLIFEKVFQDSAPYVDEVLKIPIPEDLSSQFGSDRQLLVEGLMLLQTGCTAVFSLAAMFLPGFAFNSCRGSVKPHSRWHIPWKKGGLPLGDSKEQSGKEWDGRSPAGRQAGRAFYLKRLLKAAMPSLLGCQGILALILTPSEWNHRGMTKLKAHRDMPPTLSLDPWVPRRSSLIVIPFGPRSSPCHRPPSSLSSTPSSHRTRPGQTFGSRSSPGNLTPLHPSP
eukprot:superscaffoldBa00002107_g13201